MPKRRVKKDFDPFAWWDEKKITYQDAWDKLEDKDRALKVAADEHMYRSTELDKTVGRTSFFAAIATALIAAHIVMFQLGGSLVAVIIAKVSSVITCVGPVALLWSYLPRWRSLKDRKAGRNKFISPAVWAQLIQTPFDEFARDLMRAERKTPPLDRYKNLLTIVSGALMIGLVLLVLAFVLR